MARHIGLALLVFVVCILATCNGQVWPGTPLCPVNEIWGLCGRLCEPTCAEPRRNPLLCPAIECTRFTSGCRCQQNYYRANDGSCVLLQDCQYGRIRRPVY